jgi:hypothetical protein
MQNLPNLRQQGRRLWGVIPKAGRLMIGRNNLARRLIFGPHAFPYQAFVRRDFDHTP